MKALIIVTVLFFSSFCTYAQKSKALWVNDNVPDFKLANIVNGRVSTIKFSDLKGKIIILDFWNTRCGGCIKSMPKVAELQKKFGDEVAFFLVDWEEKEIVDQFFKRRKDLQKLNLAVVTENKSLREYFPFAGNPHLVWVGKDRKVKAITGADELTEENLRKLLSVGKIDLPVKEDWIDFDEHKASILFNGSRVSNRIKFSISLFNEIDQLFNKRTHQTIDKHFVIRFYNLNIPMLYHTLFLFELRLNTYEWATRVLVTDDAKQVLSSLDLIPKGVDSTNYTLEAITPNPNNREGRKQAYKYIRRDLDLKLNLKSSVQNRVVPSLVIRVPESRQANSIDSSQVQETLETLEFVNYPANKIESRLQLASLSCRTHIIYEGPEKVKVSFKVKPSYTNIADLISDLRREGLQAEILPREIPMIVLEKGE